MGKNSTGLGLGRYQAFTSASILLLSSRLLLGEAALNFTQSTYTVSEADRVAVLRVQRTGASDSPCAVQYETLDGTAHAGVRYRAVTGTLQFASGQSIEQITVPIMNDGNVQGVQSFEVFLSHPDAAILGTRSKAAVSILNNDVGIQFAGPTTTVSAATGLGQVLLVRTEDGNQAATLDVTSSDGTAHAGVDYAGVSTRVAFARGEQAKVVPVQILNPDGKRERRNFKLTLSNPVGTCVGKQVTTTVTILNDDQGFRFERASLSVSEDVGRVPIWILRGADDLNSAVQVTYYTLDQTAQSGSDYVGVTNTLAFAPGVTRKAVFLDVLNDGVREGGEALRIALSDPSAGSVLGSPQQCLISILDNDPQVGFASPSLSIPSGGPLEAILTVVRGNDADLGPITVDYATADVSAVAGIDYEAVSGTLQFEPNQRAQTLRVRLLGYRQSAPKLFQVILSHPGGGAVLGTASAATVRLYNRSVTVGPSFSPELAVARDSGWNLLTWAGNGQVLRADNPAGPWVSMGAVKSPMPLTGTAGWFYRIKNPRPVNVYVPSNHDGHTALPLVIALHGAGGNGNVIDNYMGLTRFAEARGFFLCLPDGLDKGGTSGWNCWFDTPAYAAPYGFTWSDDVAFIAGIIDEAMHQLPVDRKRVYLIGHSNGGGMVHYAAVHCASRIAAIASLAGNPAMFYPPPSEPVNVLAIHGTADNTVPYRETVQSAPSYSPLMPGALSLGQIWADLNGAKDRFTELTPSMDLDSSLGGKDTIVTRWTTAPAGGAVEVWTLVGGGHEPSLSANFTPAVLDWLFSHPKP